MSTCRRCRAERTVQEEKDRPFNERCHDTLAVASLRLQDPCTCPRPERTPTVNDQSLLTKNNHRRQPPPLTPAQATASALNSLVAQAKDLADALKALPKVDSYRSVWSQDTTDSMKRDVLKVVSGMEDRLQRVRRIIEGSDSEREMDSIMRHQEDN